MEHQELLPPPEPVSFQVKLPPEWPSVPLDVRRRFPTMERHQYAAQETWMRLRKALHDLGHDMLDGFNNQMNNFTSDIDDASAGLSALTERVEALEAVEYYQNAW